MRFLVVCTIVAAAAACDEVAFPTPEPQEEFQAALSGANESPPVTTTASGAVIFAVTLDTFLAFRLDGAIIDSTTAAHIHEGDASVASGPILVTLFSGPASCTNATAASPRCRLDFTGQISQGQFRPGTLPNDTLTHRELTTYGVTPRERYDSLLAAMRAGVVYVNVHTRLNPAGEVRGQVQLVP